MTDVFERVLLPVGDPSDARASARALAPYVSGEVTVVHVVEKAGGAPDKASVEQREGEAEEMFAAARAELPDARTRIAYGTDVAETVFEVAEEIDATCIAFTPRGGSRWIRLLTGDVALDLVTKTDRPVVVLPDVGESENADEGTGERRVGDTDREG